MLTQEPAKANLNLVLTYRCNFTCRHCLSNCGPGRTETMSFAQARGYIDAVVEATEVQGIGYTGGEPFLVYPLLKELMSYVQTKHQLPGGVVTNCYWGRQKETAYQRIAELTACGLRNIVVSLDSLHTDFVSIEAVRNVVEAALVHKLQLTVNIVVTRKGRIAKTDAARLLKIDPALIREGVVNFKEFSPLRIGRAKECLSPEEFIETEDAQYFDAACPFVIKTPSIAPDGSVYACCCFGDTAAGSPEKLIAYCGNAHARDLKIIIAEMNNDLLLNIFQKYGPYSLLKMLQKKNPALPYRGKYLSNCGVCVDLYHQKEIREELQMFLRTAEASLETAESGAAKQGRPLLRKGAER